MGELAGEAGSRGARADDTQAAGVRAGGARADDTRVDDTRAARVEPLVVESYVALGDSFSEGVGDELPDGSCRGWADRLAQRLAVLQPGLQYANLAIRGKLLSQVIDEQLAPALAMRPDLVSIAAGGNDLLRLRTDPDTLAVSMAGAVAELTAAGSQVVLFTGFDTGGFPLLRMIRGKAEAFNGHLRSIAAKHGCLLVDLWPMAILADERAWAPDRLHLSPEGHRRVALAVCEVLGKPGEEDWREPFPPSQPARAGYLGVPAWLSARRADLDWARDYGAPWVRRRLAGTSSGDGMTAKRPDLLPL
jgi:lysophospholipase L1-like esterase